MLVALTPPPPVASRLPVPVRVTTPYPVPTTPRMAVMPLTPQPVSTATGDPRRFKLRVQPQSPDRIDVFVLGAYRVPGYVSMQPTTATPAWHGSGILALGVPATPLRANLPDPALNALNSSYALELTVRDAGGRTVARGHAQRAAYQYDGPRPTLTFQTVTFALDRPLPPSRNAYTVTVRWLTAPDVPASSRLLVSAVPKDAETSVGGRFIAPPYTASNVFRLAGSTVTPEGLRRRFVSDTESRTALSIVNNGDAGGLGPLVTNHALQDLGVKYTGVDVFAKNFTSAVSMPMAEGRSPSCYPAEGYASTRSLA